MTQNGYRRDFDQNLQQEEPPEVSVLVPICERHDDLTELYRLYSNELSKLGKSFEFIFVVAGAFDTALADLSKLRSSDKRIRVTRIPARFGESTALLEGFREARAPLIMTLASYIQIEPTDLSEVFRAYAEGYDIVVTRRYPRIDPFLNRMQSALYHFIIRKLTGTPFRDITSGLRLINREVLPKLVLYGDLHRFIPIFALQRGIRIKEVAVSQRKEDTRVRLVTPGVYLRRILDILTLFFLVKFTRKPFRFFGLIGSSLFLAGLLLTAYLTAYRLFGHFGLANRPILLLGILLMVFGIQTLSIGLIGELIIFSHAKDIQDYNIDDLLE